MSSAVYDIIIIIITIAEAVAAAVMWWSWTLNERDHREFNQSINRSINHDITAAAPSQVRAADVTSTQADCTLRYQISHGLRYIVIEESIDQLPTLPSADEKKTTAYRYVPNRKTLQ